MPKTDKPAPKPEYAPTAIRPHAIQVEIIKALWNEPGVRVVVVGTGRQMGKTEAAQMCVMEGMAQSRTYFKADIAAPTYILASEIYARMKGALLPFIHKVHDSTLTLEFYPIGRNTEGGRVKFRSLEKSDNIRGDNSDLFCIDEMCDVSESAWRAVVLPMIMARGGKALVLGTPKRAGVGFLWARNEWLKGKDRAAYPTHRSFSAPSMANPLNTPENVALMAANMTEDVYQEEILGEWLDNEGAVFKKLDKAFVLPYAEESTNCWVGGALPRKGIKYLIGHDIGAHNDYNIITVWDLSTREQVELWRIRGEDHDDVLERLHLVREKWSRATIYADGNGMGEPIVARLAKRYGDGVVDRKWSSNAMKVNDVTAARLLFEQEDWKFLAVPWQMAEFQSYTREKMPSGVWKYSAPDGGHDDAVAAACMVAERIKMEWRPTQKREAYNPAGKSEDGGLWISTDYIPEMLKKERRAKWKWPWTR
jgi:hypothetical protein